MKQSIIKSILGVATIMSLFLAGAEAATIGSQILWSGACLLVCACSAKGFKRCLTKEEQEERA